MASLCKHSALISLLALGLLPACKAGAPTARAKQVALGNDHACALLESGHVECWGLDDLGQLGPRKPGTSSDAGPDGAATDAATTSGGDAGTPDAGTTSSGDAGSADAGTDGGVPLPVKPPAQVEGLADVGGIAAGGSVSCALLPGGDVHCWGNNDHGQLGNSSVGTTGHSSAPVVVDGVQNAISVAVGPTHSCAVQEDGTVVCWGYDDAGQLGDPSHPVTGATAVAVGARHSCAVVNEGVVCWGDNTIGQLGAADGKAMAPMSGVVDVAAGGNESCALRSDGSVTCWGSLDPQCDGGCGQAPTQVTLTGTATKLAVPGLPPLDKRNFASLTACALMDDGSIECWDKTGLVTPVQGVDSAQDLDMGVQSACAVLDDASVVCWGDNSFGLLGDGTTAKHAGLVKVKL